MGCDSLITINLSFDTSSAVISQVVCDSQVSPSGNEVWTVAGTYYDTIPNVHGCDSLLTIHLSFGNSDSSLTVAACDSFLSPSGLYLWTASGTYHDTIPNSVGCDSAISLNVTSLDTGVIANDPVLTSEAAGASYQWIDCDDGNTAIPGATNQSFTAIANGHYAVVITQNGCSDTSACLAITSLDAPQSEIGALVLAPNPTNGMSMLTFFSRVSGPVRLCVLNVQGQRIEESEWNCVAGRNEKLLECGQLPAGLYLIELSGDMGTWRGRVLRE